MQLENYATPPAQTPQMRYASLHRAVERGMASDEVWNELARVCLQLGMPDEAVRAFRNMGPGALKNALESVLLRRGYLEAASAAQEKRQVHPSKVELHDLPSAKDHLADGFHYLFQDHMPLTVIVATMTFPLVVGLGGFLTAGTSIWLLPAIALLPGLSVVGIVGAMGRRILLESVKGMEEPPSLPPLDQLSREAGRFLLDALAMTALLLGPAVLMALLGLPFLTTLGAALVGASLLPMALAMRQITDDWRALSPRVLLDAVGRGGAEYLRMSLLALVLFVPAAVAGIATSGSVVYLVIAVVGPLMVLPLFVTSRMVGTFLDARMPRFRDLLDWTIEPAPVDATTPRPRPRPAPSSGALRAAVHKRIQSQAAAARRRPARQKLGAPSHPEADKGTRSPAVRRPAAKQSPHAGKSAGTGQPAGTHRAARPRPQPTRRPPRRQRKDKQRAPDSDPSLDLRLSDHSPLTREPKEQPVKVGLTDLPDLTGLGNATLLTGEEREKFGASRNKPKR